MLLLNSININYSEETNTEQKIEILEDVYLNKIYRYSIKELSFFENKQNDQYFQKLNYLFSLFSPELHLPPPEFKVLSL
jgi:hypothetical protein